MNGNILIMELNRLGWLEKKINSLFVFSPKTRNIIVNLPKYTKRTILMVVDFFLFSLALWAALSMRLGVFYTPPNEQFFQILLLIPIINLIIFFLMDIYKTVTRFIDTADIIRINIAVILATIIWTMSIHILNNDYGVFPRSTPLIYTIFAMFLVSGVRWFVRTVMKGCEILSPKNGIVKNVLVYGAGVTGVELIDKLSLNRTIKIIALIDDNPTLWGRRISGHRIHAPDYIANVTASENIQEIILALPSATISERKRVLRFLEPYPVAVSTLPALEDIISGRVSIQDLRNIDVNDLLGRDPVPPKKELLNGSILGKIVMVTGAGGSIGSELCRQILNIRPTGLLLFEISEAALYIIEQELRSQHADLMKAKNGKGENWSEIKIIALLGDVQNKSRMKNVISQYGVQTIFHAAAYKHVPLVEVNPYVAIRNNFWGTQTIANVALAQGVERFILISTDKAVRPTSIMGATKRMAEIYLQALADKHREKDDTIFSMVRFGNVLDSSGSVVQTFRQQIAQGGPVTVTHPEITRFFMSIPEAASLVIQSGAMAEGGEVYILDMGDPVKIIDLAATMIRLMGLEVRSEDNPHGDIPLSFIGLRPGEKLYEELLIEENSSQTDHPRILKNKESFIELKEFLIKIEHLDQAITSHDMEKVYDCLKKIVSGYNKYEINNEKNKR